MIVRPAQVADMQRSMNARYHEELCRFYREQAPQLVARLDDPTLLTRIEEADHAADKYGLQTDDGRVAYIGLSLAAGPSFHTDPQICGYLEMPGDDPDTKVRWLYKRVVETFEALRSGAVGNAPGHSGA